MKLETFFDKFELFADAPNAVAKLRELVLELAVTGSLAAPRSADESASDMLKALRTRREALEAKKAIKVRKDAALSEKPFDVPPRWVWARLSDVGHELGQKVPDRNFTYIDVSGIDPGKGKISEHVEVMAPNDAPSRARKVVAKGTIIYSTVRPYLRNIAIVDHDFLPQPIVSTAFAVLHPFERVDPAYVFYWLRSKPFTAYVQATMKGMAYPAINDEKFYGGPIPLPPLAEQKRIVAKVNELMALCDRLEAQQQERDARHAALARAALARFAEEPTPANLELLFHESFDIPPADLRKSILTLAVRGKLVSRCPADGDARELLRRVRSERERAIEVSHLRRKRVGDPQIRTPCTDLPTSWCVEQLAQLVDPAHTISYGVLVPGSDVPGGIPFVRVQDLSVSSPAPRPAKAIAAEVERPYARTRLTGGEILLCVVGSVGKLGVAPPSWAGANIARAVARIKPVSQISRDYLLIVLQESRVQEYFSSLTRTLAQPTLNVSSIEGTPVPIPPLAEQRRIVAKVDELMALVDKLDAQQAAARTTAARLLDAAIAELTRGEPAGFGTQA